MNRVLTFLGRHLLVACVVVAGLHASPVLIGSVSASDRQEHAQSPRIPCEALFGVFFNEGAITSAVAVPAAGAIPAYCRVLATVEPETDIELRLPESWEQRLVQFGSSGLGGFIPNLNNRSARLVEGYALVASNTGHRDPTGGATRFLDAPILVQDYSYGAIGKTVEFAKAVLREYYGRKPKYSYYAGCSSGGREGLNAAAKFGKEFDGILAGAPPRNFPGIVSRWALSTQLEAPSAAKLATLDQAQVSQCDAVDGLADGIISHPEACRFDVASLRCPDGVNSDSCLTDAEIDVVKTLRADLRLANGRLAYPGFGVGNPATGFGVFMPTGGPGTPNFATFLAGSFLPYMVYNNPAYDPTTFDLDADFPTVLDVFERQYDFTANTDPLAHFLRTGNKILLWHGAEDTLVSHEDTIRSFGRLTDAAGRHAANARLYVLPGVQHCGGGNGASQIDFLSVLRDWVERGRSPRNLVATRNDPAGNVLFARPLCEYPNYPRYEGEGDPADAASFRCVAPTRRDEWRDPWR
jgi:tannase/feruloyl esterase